MHLKRLFMQKNHLPTAYKVALHDHILSSAIEMFTQKGIRAVKMDDIATTLQISKRTLYELFQDKEDLLFNGLKKIWTERAEELKSIAASMDNVMDILLEVFKLKASEFSSINPKFYTDLARYPRLREYFAEDKKRSHQQMVEFMKRGVSEGYFRENVNYDLFCCILDAQNSFVISERLYLTYPMQDIFSNMIFVSIRGICTQKGLDVLDRFAESLNDGTC